MGVVNIIAKIKQIHPEFITLVEIGNFYYVYGKDAYILSYLFQYKLNKTKEEKISSCAFPKKSYPKVIATLENKKMNYLILDRRNNYDIEEKSDHKNLNTYSKYFQKANTYVNVKFRMDRIYQYILENYEKENIKQKLKEMESIINETGKI